MATRGDPKEDSKPALSTVARELMVARKLAAEPEIEAEMEAETGPRQPPLSQRYKQKLTGHSPPPKSRSPSPERKSRRSSRSPILKRAKSRSRSRSRRSRSPSLKRVVKSPISPIQSSGSPKSRSPSPKPKSRSPESTVGKTENEPQDIHPSRKISVRTAERVRAEYPDFDTRRISLGTQKESRAAYPYFDEPKALVKFVQTRERYNPEPPTEPPSSSDTAALTVQEESLAFDESHKYFINTICTLILASCLLCPISIIFSLVALYFATLEWHFRIRARQLWRTSKKWNTLSFATSVFWASMYAMILIYVGIYYLVRKYHRAGAFDEDNLNPELNQTEIVDTMDINSTLIQ